MPDRSCSYRRSSGDITPKAEDASANHYWLMRRDLGKPLHPANLPAFLDAVDFTRENAGEVHALLRLGTGLGGGRVADFETWMLGFKNNPEFDPTLCFVVADPMGVVAVAQCWTSAFIRYMVVHPRAQRRGVGLALLNQVFETFIERREGQVDLNVMEHNLTARRLYERAGMLYVQRCELAPH